MKIFLVRHGQSESNINKTMNQVFPDHMVGLTELGKEQAVQAGEKIFKYVLPEENFPIRLWTSPYKRTRETSKIILETLNKLDPHLNIEYREHINLVEQQFGLFDGIPNDELPVRFPLEHTHYKKCEDHKGKFWARMPLGESRFDVAVRVHAAFGTFQRDCKDSGIDNIIVVSHGVTIRAFLMQWLHYSVEWFEEEPNPDNCSVRMIYNNSDMGYLK